MPESLEQRLDKLQEPATAAAVPPAFLARLRRRRWQRRSPGLVVLAFAMCAGALWLSTPAHQPPVSQPSIVKSPRTPSVAAPAACTLAALRNFDPFTAVDLPAAAGLKPPDAIFTPLTARSSEAIENLAARL